MNTTGSTWYRSRTLIPAVMLTLAGFLPSVPSWLVPHMAAQSTPFGLDLVAPVNLAGSDDASASFQQNVLPAVTDFLNTQLSESQSVDASAMLLDPTRLELQTASDVRVYFIGEGAGYHNTLGFTTDGSGSVTSDTAALIFPDASSSVSTYDPASTPLRTTSAPLLPGDFVDLGTLDAGTLLDFFLIANGASGGSNVYSTETSLNPDGINHVVAFSYAIPDSPYLIIGFEDLYGGGDKDYNDLLFAVDIGAANIKALTANSEPAFLFILGGFGAFVWSRRRPGPVQGRPA
ncbi:MAG: DUF4114 domain-containing protein [Verrucomicrobiales bacterium]|nr:DUF4114 domain-containing protein [Verrucomicrobiales bacterium]